MKIKIADLEKRIKYYKIKRNFISFGLDTAQVSGLVTLRTDNDYVHIEDYIVLSFKTKNHKEIYRSMVKTFEKMIDKNTNLAVIESVFVGKNAAGSVELAKYGSFAIAECIKKDINYEIISAVSAKSKLKIDTMRFGAGKAKEAVGWWLKNVLGINLTDNNIQDACVLSILGICDGLDFKPNTVKKKTVYKRKTK